MKLKIKTFAAYEDYIKYLSNPGVLDFNTLCLITDKNQLYLDRLNITSYISAVANVSQDDSTSNPIVDKLTEEIKSLRDEISTLKSEIATLKTKI